MEIHGIAPLLQVFDMPIAIRFYRDVLGFEVTASSEPRDDCNWAALKLNGAEVMLNTAYEAGQRPRTPDPQRNAVHSDTCLFFSCEDLDSAYLPPSAGAWHYLRATKSCPIRDETVVVPRSRWIRNLLAVASDSGNVRSLGGGVWPRTQDDRKLN
jgi:hypothetical protein